MPNLPGLSVTNAQLPIIIDHFAAKDTARTAQENYLRWMRHQIIDDILAARVDQIGEMYRAELEKLNARRDAALAELKAQLEDPADPYSRKELKTRLAPERPDA